MGCLSWTRPWGGREGVSCVDDAGERRWGMLLRTKLTMGGEPLIAQVGGDGGWVC